MLWLRTDFHHYMTVIGLHQTDCTGANWISAAFQLDVTSAGTLYVHNALPNRWSTVSTTIQANAWTHIAFTVSSSYLVKLYKNGIYIGQATGTSNFATNTFQSLFIGGSGECNRGFHGYIQDLRMYNRELPANEIFNITFPNNTYLNSVTNILTACPVGSISTGNSCTCVENTYFNSVTSTCDPNGMTMQFLFDGAATNTGSLSGSSTLTTIGTPTLNSSVSAVDGKS